jgi:drug/metabolite transporter (DMT)-like permease
MHPVVTTVFAWVVLGEKLNRIRTLGVCLGVAGVVFVVIEHGGTGDGVSAPAMWAMVVAVVGMSSGTLVQRQLGQGTPLLSGTAWQYASTTVALGFVAVFGEGWRFEMTANTLWSLAWAVGVLSIAAILIMLWLLRRQAASQVSSLFFLTPALSSVEAAILFDEKLGGLAVLGLGVALVGVFLATNQRFVSAPQP